MASATTLWLGAAATPNRLDGGPGDDRLVGVGAGDRAFGGPGSDSLCRRARLAPLLQVARAGRGDRTAVDLYSSIGDTTAS